MASIGNWYLLGILILICATPVRWQTEALNSDSPSNEMLIFLENQSEGGYKKNNDDPGSSCTESVQWTNNENCIVGPVSVGENVADDVFHQLCPQPIGRFQAPASCNLYITCHYNQLTINQCPLHYHFDESHQQCVEAETYECSYPVEQDPRRIFQRDYNKRQVKAESKEGSPLFHVQKLSNEDEDDGHSNSKRFAKCPETYISPHPYDCSSFQICSNNQIFNQKCGPGTFFNPLSQVCDYASNVDCSSRMSDYGTYDCQPGYEYSTSHFDDCTKFIECSHGSLTIKSCSDGTAFNPEKGMCDFKYKTECRVPLSFEHDTDVNYQYHGLKRSEEEENYNGAGRRERSPDLEKYSCEFNYIAPVEGICNEFIECEDKRLYKKTCGPGTAYNPLLGQCDWPYNVRTPDPKYCSRYLQCDGRQYRPRECPNDTFFNAFTGRCEPSYKVDCKGKVDDPNQQITLSLNRS